MPSRRYLLLTLSPVPFHRLALYLCGDEDKEDEDDEAECLIPPPDRLDTYEEAAHVRDYKMPIWVAVLSLPVAVYGWVFGKWAAEQWGT